MKKILLYILSISVMFGLNSCLHYDLEELPSFDEANITSITGVQYRYFSDAISPVNGEKMVKYVTLKFSTTKIDPDNATCSFDVSAPSSFPADRLSDLGMDKLVVIVQLSTAARCAPVGDSPAFGVPGDWTKPNKYTITAADGTTKVWTVTVNKLTK